MPHCLLEYSKPDEDKFNISVLLNNLHRAVSDYGLFQPGDVKSRAIGYDNYLVGTAQNGNFIHITVMILTGRSAETKNALSLHVWQVIHDAVPDVTSLTVEVREMEREAYTK